MFTAPRIGRQEAQEAEDASQGQEIPSRPWRPYGFAPCSFTVPPRPHSVTGASRPSISHLSIDPKRPKTLGGIEDKSAVRIESREFEKE